MKQSTGLTFSQARLRNPTVAQIMDAGGTAEDCVVALLAEREDLIARLVYLEGIALRKIKFPSGLTVISRCPDDLVPETPR